MRTYRTIETPRADETARVAFANGTTFRLVLRGSTLRIAGTHKTDDGGVRWMNHLLPLTSARTAAEQYATQVNSMLRANRGSFLAGRHPIH